MPELTATEMEVKRLVDDEFLTVKQVAQRRQTTPRAVQLMLNKIREKGAGGVANFATRVGGRGGEVFRVHAQRWSVGIVKNSSRYLRHLKQVVKSVVKGATVQFYEDKVILYGNGYGFVGVDVDAALKKSFAYWGSVAAILENDLGIILVKERRYNWHQFGLHVAELGNELAVDYNREKNKLQVHGRDGKVWLLIDNSFNLNELEAVHSVSAAPDMRDVVVPFFNDIKDKESLLPSEVWRMMQKTERHVHEIAAGLNAIVQLNKPKQPEVSSEKVVRPDYVG